MLIRQAITGLVSAVAMVLGAPPATASPPNEFFGVVKGAPLTATDTHVMAASGVGSVRFFLYWRQVETSPGNFDWSQTDQVVGSLAADGISAVPFAFGSPAWLSASPQAPPLTQAGKAAWRRFLVAAVSRYGPGGTYWQGVLSPYHLQFGLLGVPEPITSWQIWNEPNFKNYWLPKPSPAGYARLVKISHQAIAGVDSGAQVVLAGMPGYVNLPAWKFLDGIYRTPGIKRSFDAVALHPYARNVAQLKIEIKKMRAVMARNGDASTPLWLTELGWGSGSPSESDLNKGTDGQSHLLSQAFNLILRERTAWNIGRLFWFDWRDGGSEYYTGNCNFCHTAGLLDHSGVPKPAWNAFRGYSSGG